MLSSLRRSTIPLARNAVRGSLTVLVLTAVALAACEQQDTTEMQNRIERLEGQLEVQQSKVESLAIAATVSSASVFDSPLSQFFAAPEFWEVIYEDQGACHNRCYAAFQSMMQSCAGLATEADIDACKLDAASETVACHEGCRQ